MASFCHCCGEATSGSNAVACRNRLDSLANGQPACTKTICRDCFTYYGWDWRSARADRKWTCTHCRGVCPRCCLVPVAAPSGPLAAQLKHAEHTARYLACLQTIASAQPSAQSGAHSQEGGGDLADRLATMLAVDQSATGKWLASALVGDDISTGAHDAGGVGGDSRFGQAGAHGDVDGAAEAWGLGGEERLACWGSPTVRGDAWGHEGGAGAAVLVRTGGGSSASSQSLLVLIGGRTTASVTADGSVVADYARGSSGGVGGGTLVQAFDASTRQWVAVRQSGVPPHRLRAHACCAFDAGRVLISGGGDGRRVSPELFALDLSAFGASSSAAADDEGGRVSGGSGGHSSGSAGGSSGGIAAAVAAVAGAAVSTAAALGGGGGLGGGLGGGVHARWTHPQVRGAAPSPRVGHCAVRMGVHSMLIFGGFAVDDGGGGGGGGSGGDGAEVGGGDCGLSTSVPGLVSASRRGHRSGKSRDRTGGGGGGGSYSNAIYALDASKSAWSMPTVHIAPGSAPPLARLGATATALHEREVVLFGGSHGGRPCACLDVLSSSSADLGSSEAFLRVGQPATSGAPPEARFNHCACLLGLTDIAIFGGGGGADGRTPLCSVGLLDTTQMRWAVLEFRGVPPAPRNACIGAVVGAERRLWVFGGCASGDARPYNDVHTLDVSRRVVAAPCCGCGGGDASMLASAAAGGGGAMGAGPLAGGVDGKGGGGGGGYGTARGVGSCGGGAEVSRAVKQLRPPPPAKLAPARQALTPPLMSSALQPLRPLRPVQQPSRPPPRTKASSTRNAAAAGGEAPELGGRISPLLVSEVVCQAEIGASAATTTKTTTGTRPGTTGTGAPPPAPVSQPLVPVLQAQNVKVTPASAASTSAAPAHAPAAAPPIAPEGRPPSESHLLPGPECTTVLVRRNGAYVMTIVKEEGCPGCDLCRGR